MMQSQYQRGYGGMPARLSTGGQDVPDEPRDNDDAMDCPECGRPLADMKQRQKEAMLHYGTDNIPRYPNHNLAAERKGALLGVDPATLRG